MRFPTFVSDKYGVRDEACPIITGGWGGRDALPNVCTRLVRWFKRARHKRGDPTGIRLKGIQPGFD